ncbi:hypothetical protein HDU87_006445 [Geranomyces variabilis]|uniref:Trafficking protein particle complex subunit 11 domain-containing protein n=1 Tax=Geranomyces variabilis TaxID=109894 RepID=A0AAD5THU1_9FUNG|nr:hypothetical protein HDU87_006445 [Geranomyces variabilis]
MESYPLEYVLHHVPLMAVLGLLEPEQNEQQDDAEGIGAVRKSLLSALMAKNNASIWDASGKKEAAFFHVTVLDKTHVFPPRKNTRQTPVQHSNLSPLNPASPLHPEGVMTPSWIQRHKETRPSVVVGFYDLWERPAGALDSSVDPLGAPSALNLERERDLILCSEVMEKKRNTTERGIKFAAVVILRYGRFDDPHVDERLAFIRRTCGLDAKALFILFAHSDDLPQFVTSLQRSLYEQSANYYREHDKRIRKKKARIPPIAAARTTSPTSAVIPAGQPPKPLPPVGWHLRYEYKLGVFAEFRQDVEVAIRHYDTTYQLLSELLYAAISQPNGASVVHDFLNPFTPRWSEARTLLDSVNLKICKLQLYTDRPVSALQQLERHISSCKGFPEFVSRGSAEEHRKVSPSISKLGNATGGSFEYWAWVSIQYRVFGELIELATSKIGLRLPYPPPGTVLATSSTTGQGQSFLNTISSTSIHALSGGENAAAQFGPLSATNPSQVVQHAGYYYLVAASCAEERWKEFKQTEKAKASAPPPPPSAAATGSRSGSRVYDSMASPFSPLMSPTQAHSFDLALASEESVDHATLVIELLTKSYEQFKKHRAGRMTLFLASEIARVYEQSGKYEMALKFFERIGKTYRKERWPAVLKDVLRWSSRCAWTLGRWDVVAECLVELLGERMATPGSDGDAEREQVLRELLDVISGSVDGDGGQGLKLAIDMDQIDGFLQCSVQFRKHSTYVGVAAPFQIYLKAAGSKSPPVPLSIARVHVTFSDSRFDHVLTGTDAGAAPPTGVQWIDCTDCALAAAPSIDGRDVWSKTVDLQFQPGMTKVLEGIVTPGEGLDLKILAVSVVVTSGQGALTLAYKISDRAEDTTTRRKWYTAATVADDTGGNRWTMLDGSGEQSVLRVIRKQPNLGIRLVHSPPGLLDEDYGVDVEVVNEEAEDVEAFLDVEFRSSGTDGVDATSQISELSDLNDAGAAPAVNSIDLIYLGIIPAHEKCTRRFRLRCTHTAGERVMYNIVNYRAIQRAGGGGSGPEKATPATHSDLFFRKNEPVRLAFVAPFAPEFTEQAEFGAPFDTGEAGLLSGVAARLELHHARVVALNVVCPGPWEIEVADISFERDKDGRQVAGVHSMQVEAIDNGSAAGGVRVWKAGSVESRGFRVVATVDPTIADVTQLAIGAVKVRWRRLADGTRNADSGHGNTTGYSDGKRWVETSLPLPRLQALHSSVCACIDIPPLICYAEPFTVTYTLCNLSAAVCHVSMTMDVSESFVFGGYKQTQVRLLPLSTTVMTYNCVAIACGRATLPRLRLLVINAGAEGSGDAKDGGGGGGREIVDVRVRGGVDSGVGSGGELVVFVRPIRP